jgi:hypothetical protein
MLLKEFLYFNDDVNDFSVDRRYDNKKDDDVLSKDDTRKIRLTLRQINQLRLQSEAHVAEKESELDFIRQMYGAKLEQEE